MPSPLRYVNRMRIPSLSFLIPVRHGNDVLVKTINQLTSALVETGKEFEILLVPNHHPDDVDDGTEALCKGIAEKNEKVKVVVHEGQVGKGAALKTGMQNASGSAVLFMDADLPYHTDCIQEAITHLENGADFVTANRRIEGSRFVCSVQVLPLVYRRHRYGLLFNKVARTLFGLKTLDTQAGFKAFSRRMVDAVVELQACSGFLADVEYFLICKANNFRHAEIPVKFYLYNEKSTVRLFRETKNSITWFSILYFRKLLGKYKLPRLLRTSTVS